MAIQITQGQSRIWDAAGLARLARQATALLKETLATPGVRRAFICDYHGAALAVQSEESITVQVMDRAGLALAQILAVLESRGGRSKEIEMQFQGTRVLARDLGHAFVVVACAPNASAALLRMALNVSAPAFESDIELQNYLRRAAPSIHETLTERDLGDAGWRLSRRANPV